MSVLLIYREIETERHYEQWESIQAPISPIPPSALQEFLRCQIKPNERSAYRCDVKSTTNSKWRCRYRNIRRAKTVSPTNVQVPIQDFNRPTFRSNRTSNCNFQQPFHYQCKTWNQRRARRRRDTGLADTKGEDWSYLSAKLGLWLHRKLGSTSFQNVP